MRLQIITQLFVIVTNACSGDFFVTLVIDTNQKERNGLLINTSIALKVGNGYFLPKIVLCALSYTPRELAERCIEKSPKGSHHTTATQDIGTIAGKQEFPQHNAICITSRTVNANGVRALFILDK